MTCASCPNDHGVTTVRLINDSHADLCGACRARYAGLIKETREPLAPLAPDVEAQPWSAMAFAIVRAS